MKIGVIGSTHAGVFAAKQIKQEHPDYDITVFEKNETVSFLSCGIALWVGKHVSDPARMFYESPESLTKQGIVMKMRHEVTEADLATKTLHVKDLGQNIESVEQFDKLVITTGSKAVIPKLDGIDSEKIYFCKTWDDANKIKKIADDLKRVIVIGAGYIGAELAEQFSLTGKEVTLIDGTDRVLAKNLGPVFTERVEEKYRENGVQLALNQFVAGFEDTADGIKVTTSTGETYEADIAVLGIGFIPNTSLVADQLETLKNGAIITNKYMETSVSDVYAAGDSSAVFYNPTQENDYIPLATNAIRQGILVGNNIEDHKVAYLGTQATSAVELYEQAIAATGLNAISAKAKGVDAVETVIETDYRPDFMLSTTKVLASLTWEVGTRRVIGAAFMSEHDVTQAANTVSLAIQKNMTVDELAMSDFFFQPNFSQPVNYVGEVALTALAEAK